MLRTLRSGSAIFCLQMKSLRLRLRLEFTGERYPVSIQSTGLLLQKSFRITQQRKTKSKINDLSAHVTIFPANKKGSEYLEKTQQWRLSDFLCIGTVGKVAPKPRTHLVEVCSLPALINNALPTSQFGQQLVELRPQVLQLLGGDGVRVLKAGLDARQALGQLEEEEEEEVQSGCRVLKFRNKRDHSSSISWWLMIRGWNQRDGQWAKYTFDFFNHFNFGHAGGTNGGRVKPWLVLASKQSTR